MVMLIWDGVSALGDTSASNTRRPVRASALAMAVAKVVFPTPPLPVTMMNRLEMRSSKAIEPWLS
jgi:hypothetical protein